MATLLIATPDGGVVRRVPLDPRRAYSIGRSPRCTIPLAQRSVSRRHALLFRHGGTWWVADCGSSRGLRVEEGPTRFAPLTLERWVGIGPLVCWLLASAERPDTSALVDDPEDLSGLDLNDSVETEALPDGHSTSVGEEPTDYLLLQPAGGGPVKLVHVAGVDHVTIGSDPGCAVRLAASEHTAPLHAVAFREPRCWVVVAAGGGVSVDGQRYLRKRIEQSSVIDLGGYALRAVDLDVADPEHDGSAVRIVPVAPPPSAEKAAPSAADLYRAPTEGSASIFLQPSKSQRFAPKGGETPLI